VTPTRAVLLAAGRGTRLRPLTDGIPKCLVPIHGRPLLDYWLELLLTGGIDRVLVNTHYLPQQVRTFVSRSRWRDRVVLAHEDVLCGTAGTLARNRDFCGGRTCLVAHADNLSRFDPAAFLERHRRRPAGAEITMMTFLTDVPSNCGIVEEDAAGIVVGFHEKVSNPPGNVANAAVYALEATVIDFIAGLGDRAVDLSADVLPHFVGRICTYRNTGYHRDIGTPEGLRQAAAEWVDGDAGAGVR
jgi:mannose-1-phosphate guanylyltransferase